MSLCPRCQQPLSSPGARCAVCQKSEPAGPVRPPELPMRGPPQPQRRPPPRHEAPEKLTIAVAPEKIHIPPAPLHDLRADDWENGEQPAPAADDSSHQLRQKLRDLTAIAGLLVALLLLLVGSLLLFVF